MEAGWDLFRLGQILLFNIISLVRDRKRSRHENQWFLLSRGSPVPALEKIPPQNCIRFNHPVDPMERQGLEKIPEQRQRNFHFCCFAHPPDVKAYHHTPYRPRRHGCQVTRCRLLGGPRTPYLQAPFQIKEKTITRLSQTGAGASLICNYHIKLQICSKTRSPLDA